MGWAQVTEVIKALGWPVTTLVVLATLYRPIVEVLRAIGQRATKFSVFKVEVELGELTRSGPNVRTTLGALKQQVVSESGPRPTVCGGRHAVRSG
jgi:hypothetical protein